MSKSKATSATNTESVQAAIKNLTKFVKKLETVPVEELQKSAQDIKAMAIMDVPYKTGKLERSIKVTVSTDKRRPGLRASASAVADNGYNYAGIQHEAWWFDHPVQGKDHFISDPFNAEVEGLKLRLRDRLKVVE